MSILVISIWGVYSLLWFSDYPVGFDSIYRVWGSLTLTSRDLTSTGMSTQRFGNWSPDCSLSTTIPLANCSHATSPSCISSHTVACVIGRLSFSRAMWACCVKGESDERCFIVVGGRCRGGAKVASKRWMCESGRWRGGRGIMRKCCIRGRPAACALTCRCHGMLAITVFSVVSSTQLLSTLSRTTCLFASPSHLSFTIIIHPVDLVEFIFPFTYLFFFVINWQILSY